MPHTEPMPHEGGSTSPDSRIPDSPAPAAVTAAGPDVGPDTASPAAASPAPEPIVVRPRGSNPNAPPTEEVVAATFPSSEVADRAIGELVAVGVDRANIVCLSDRAEKRDFLKQFIHRDGDRHTHGGVGAVFSGLLGALALGMISVATISQYLPQGIGPIAAALVGGVVGGALGAVLGGLALRPSDDSSVEIIENYAAQGTLIAVRRPLGSGTVSLDEVGRLLQRYNGRAVRLRHHVSQADRHPGDLRPDQMWVNNRPGVAAPPKG